MWAVLARYEWALVLATVLGLGVVELIAVNRAIRRIHPVKAAAEVDRPGSGP